MEEATTIIEKVKRILFGDGEPAKQKFLDATLEDGTMVNIEPAIELEAAVVVIDAEGNPSAALDGEHTLADGTKIVTVAGLIKEIIEVTTEPAAVVDEQLSVEPTETQEQRVKKVVESIVKESHFASEEMVKNSNEDLKKQFSEDLAKAKQEIKELIFTAFTQFGEQAKNEPTEKPKATKKKNIFHN